MGTWRLNISTQKNLDYVLNKTNLGTICRNFRKELMNIEIDNDEEIDWKNMSDMITGVVLEEESEMIKIPKILAYRMTVKNGSGHNNVVYARPPQEYVEEQNKTKTR